MMPSPITTLPVDAWLRIGDYTFVDLSVLSRAMRGIAGQVFDQLKTSYAVHPVIRKFMPFPFELSEAPSRTIVYMTDEAIKRFGCQIVRDNFMPERCSLESLVRTLEKIQLSMQDKPDFVSRQIIKHACKDGDVPVVRGMLASGIRISIQSEEWEWQELLEMSRSTNSDQALIWTFLEANRDGLLQDFCVEVIGDSLIYATEQNYPLLVDECLATNMFGDLDEVREEAVTVAALRGRLPILQTLMLAETSDECRGGALSIAAGRGDFDMVQFLLQNGPFPERSVESAIAETTNFDILEALYEHRQNSSAEAFA